MALALLVGLFASARFYTDFLWLMSLGYEHVLLRTLTAQAAVFAAAFALSIVFFVPNFEALRRSFRLPGGVGGKDNIHYYRTEQPWRESLDNILGSKNVTLVL